MNPTHCSFFFFSGFIMFSLYLFFWHFNSYYFETITHLEKFTGRTFLPDPFENEFAYRRPLSLSILHCSFLSLSIWSFLINDLSSLGTDALKTYLHDYIVQFLSLRLSTPNSISHFLPHPHQEEKYPGAYSGLFFRTVGFF